MGSDNTREGFKWCMVNSTSLIWKNRMWKLYQRYAHISEVEEFEPELAHILTSKTSDFNVVVKIGAYNYMLKSDGFVIKIHRSLARSPNEIREPKRATHKHKLKIMDENTLDSFLRS